MNFKYCTSKNVMVESLLNVLVCFTCVLCLVSDPEGPNLDNYPIHTITGLLKRWLRELPDPLMTFSLYNDFLHAVGE